MSRWDSLFDRLDDRMMVLYQIDEAVKRGRFQGETVGMLVMAVGERKKYERTAESRLLKHYERQWKRLRRAQYQGEQCPRRV